MTKGSGPWHVVMRIVLGGASIFGMSSATLASDVGENLSAIRPTENGNIVHCDQNALNQIVDQYARFMAAFSCGDSLFETRFNALDGVGGNVGDGGRFTRIPRADQIHPTGWANHVPSRSTGPNAEACNVCHLEPPTGSGSAGLNVIRDPFKLAKPASFIQRNTTHTMGSGALQLLAEEITAQLQDLVKEKRQKSCAKLGGGWPIPVDLTAKGISFGSMIVRCDGNDSTVNVEGVDPDLVVRPFQWKGTEKTVRAFNREASHNEIGMQPVELVGFDEDGDYDGVVNEFTIGDLTALTIYVAAQPRPVTKLELAQLGLIELDPQEITGIRNGSSLFDDIDCDNCHRPSLKLINTVFSEPSQYPSYRDEVFPAGISPLAVGVDHNSPVTFNMTRDLPDNLFLIDGEKVRLGNLETDENGHAIVRLYGDLKRHEMGPDLAENIDETGSGRSTWLTKELWGVGSTAPYLHDGRATTLVEAIMAHGGEALWSRQNFIHLTVDEQNDLVAFLKNLILFKDEH